MKEKSLRAWLHRPRLSRLSVAGLILGCASSVSIVFAQAPETQPAAPAGVVNPFASFGAPAAPAAPVDAANAPAVANPFAAVPTAPGAAPSAAVTTQPSPQPANAAGGSFANPFKNIFRRPGTPRTPAAPRTPRTPRTPGEAAPKPTFSPPNELVVSMRKAIAEQRYNDIKELAEQYAMLDPKSGLSEFFVNLSRIRKDALTESQQPGALFLAQYGGRSGATQPSTQPISSAPPTPGMTMIASAKDETQSATAPAVASVSSPGATPAEPAPGIATPPAVIATAVTPSPAPAPDTIRPVEFEPEESILKTYQKPAAIGGGAIVLIGMLLVLVRRKKSKAQPVVKSAPVAAPEAEATSSAPKSDSQFGLGMDTPSNAPKMDSDFGGLGMDMPMPEVVEAPVALTGASAFGDPFEELQSTGPTQTLQTGGLEAMDGFEELNFGPAGMQIGPAATGELPVDEDDEPVEPPSKIEFGDMLSSPDDDMLQLSASSKPQDIGSAQSQSRGARDASVDDLLNFIPMEQERQSGQAEAEKPSGLGLSEFDLGAMEPPSEQPSEQPSRDESMGGLSFEDLLTAAPPPLANPPSRGSESALSLNDFDSTGSRGSASALSLNDFESTGRGSSYGERSSGSAPIGFDDLLVTPPPGNIPDETGSSLDLNNIELPSAPSAEQDSFISDFDDIKTPSVDTSTPREMERTDDFHKKFEDLMFNVIPPPPPPEDTAADTLRGQTTTPITDMNIRWTGSPDDTQPSDLGMEMDERSANEDTQTDTRPFPAATPPDTKQDTPVSGQRNNEDTQTTTRPFPAAPKTEENTPPGK